MEQKRKASLTCAAGEHFVASHLSAMGYAVGLTRAGCPGVDLMVGSPNGQAAISIQVKTASWARRRDGWQWNIGPNGLLLKGEMIFYALVDLKWGAEKRWDGAHQPIRPDVFLVPSHVIADSFRPNWKMYLFNMPISDESKYRERWDFISGHLDR